MNDSPELALVAPNINVSGCTYSIHILKGIHKVIPNKKQQANRDYVTVFMCLFRFNEPYDTDLLLTFNVPDKFTIEEDDKC